MNLDNISFEWLLASINIMGWYVSSEQHDELGSIVFFRYATFDTPYQVAEFWF